MTGASPGDGQEVLPNDTPAATSAAPPQADAGPGSGTPADRAVGEDGSDDATALLEELRAFVGQPASPTFESLEPVNPAMIRHWCEVTGDRNPRYQPGPDQVAPPAMLQAWCMRGLVPPPIETAQSRLRDRLRADGYVGVVATNSTQTYARDLRPGDRLREERVIESVSDPKRTSLGDGFFVTTRSRYLDAADEVVAEMTFRILHFRPAARSGGSDGAEGNGGAARPQLVARRPRPPTNQDNEFFFAAAREGRLLIQQCGGCGILQHPPTPVCPECGSFERGVVEPCGRGQVYSYVVNHHPQVPGFTYPLVVALVELEEGVRLVTNLVGVEPGDVRIGMPVELELVPVDDELTLPMFRPTPAPTETGETRAGAAVEIEERPWTSR